MSHLHILFLNVHYSLKVKGLTPDTDVQALAWQIISRCDLIQPSRLPEVEQLLLYLQSRKGVSEGKNYLN